MVLWAAIVGTFVGWLLGEFEELGFVLGGCIGAVFGWGMRRSMRAEVEDATATLREQVEALRLLLADRSSPNNFAPEQPVTVPDRARAEMPIEPPATPHPAASYDVAPPTDDYARSPDAAHRPGWIEGLTVSAFAAARNWLFGGNTIVRLGLVVLFVGLSFLASYAASAGLFPIEWRLAIVALVGMALLLVGFRARVERPGFGLALQGGGIAIIYLALFAAAIAALAITSAAADPLVPVRILGRDDAEQPWTPLGQGIAAHTTRAIPLSGDTFRLLRIEEDSRSTGFTTTPSLRLGFAPADIVFLAAGTPPYTLAAGRAEDTNRYLPLDSLAADADSRSPALAHVAVAPARVALAAAADPQRGSRQLLLWAVLLTATALLGTLAWRLSQSGSPTAQD